MTETRPTSGTSDTPSRRDELRWAAALGAVALAGAVAIAGAPTLGVIVCGGLLLVLLSARFPVPALAVYLAVNPLLAGAERGALVPLVRLNEALLVPLVAGLLLAGLHTWTRAPRVAPRGLHRLDLLVAAVTVTGSVTTLLWMYARERTITTEDLLYALTLWKLAVIYAVVRAFVRGAGASRTLLHAGLLGAVVVAAIGLLQASGIGPVIEALARLTPPEEDGYAVDGGRATSTLGNPIAYGDVMIYASVIAASLALRGLPPRNLLLTTATLTSLGALASGQVSVLLGLVVAAAVLAVATGTVLRTVLAAVVVGVAAVPLLQPVVAARLGDTDPHTGLPSSWTGRHGRLENLQNYFWPELWSDWNWLLGVRPAARLPGAETWRDWVYIESGHTWLLWTGGLPLALATLALLVTAGTTGARLRRSTEPIVGAVGTSLLTVTLVLSVLLIFDPHLTLRGGAEMLFTLLALGAGLDSSRTGPTPVASYPPGVRGSQGVRT